MSVQPPRYVVKRARGPILVDGRLDEPDWAACATVGPFVFPWHESGEKEQTRAKVLWDDENLYLAFDCDGRHISAFVTEHDGPVWRDSCVELFTAPDPGRWEEYYTFEINCTGFALHRCFCKWWKKDTLAWDPVGMRIGTSAPGPTKEESPGDDGWQVEVAIPLANFAEQAVNCPPKPGDTWRANLQRTGGKTNAQDSCWANYPTPDNTSFHQPRYFGTLIFSDECVL